MARNPTPDPDPQEVLAIIAPRPARRVVSVGLLAVLGGLLLYITAVQPPRAAGWFLFLLIFSLGALALSWRMWQITGRVIELTREELREAGPGGRVLARLDQIDRVDRGMFAFKPAGGFVVHLRARQPRVIAPGLWWRIGRRLAVGGVTARAEAKQVADLMTILLIERDKNG